jgi:hypothetical protein
MCGTPVAITLCYELKAGPFKTGFFFLVQCAGSVTTTMASAWISGCFFIVVLISEETFPIFALY